MSDLTHDVFLNRHNLALVELASKDACRFALCGVYVEAGRTIATDGHCLGIVDTPKVEAIEFPDAGDVETPTAALKPAIIPTDGCKAIAKALPRRSHLPVLLNARVDVNRTNANGSVRVVSTDLETTTPVDVKKIEGEFPDVSQVLPSGEPVLTIGFNALLLARVLKVAGTMARGAANGVKLEFFDKKGTGPVKITCETEEGQAATFLVMPVRL